MDWDQYYEKFYDWATSTQISRGSVKEFSQNGLQALA